MTDKEKFLIKFRSMPRWLRYLIEWWINLLLLARWLKDNLEMTMVKLGAIFLVVAVYRHFRTDNIGAIEWWATITLFFWAFFAVRRMRERLKKETKNAHWITKTQPHK